MLAQAYRKTLDDVFGAGNIIYVVFKVINK